MRRQVLRFASSLLVISVLVSQPAALAQSRPRMTVLVNGGYQPTSTSFDDRFTFTANQETGTTEVSYPVDAGPLVEAGAAIRVWRGLAIGAVVTRFEVDTTVDARSSVPHPFFFGRHRVVTGQAPGVQRQENAVHVQIQYELPPLRNLRLLVSGGPTIFDLRQDLVSNVRYREEYPYDTATFDGVESRRTAATTTGFNVGMDARWMFTRHVGLGGGVRLTQGRVDFAVDDRTVRVDAGGTQVAAGIRLAF